MPPDTDPRAPFIAGFIAGFVAAEGSFVVTGPRPRFSFSVTLGASDASTCRMLQEFFGCGTLHESPRRAAHYDDECAFVIRRLGDHVETTIPFMDAHLPMSHKREQYVVWRDRLLDYWEHRARRALRCSIDGCEAPRRARGLCRHHLDGFGGV